MINIFKKIFPPFVQKKEYPLSIEKIQIIVSEYGRFLEKSPLAPECVADTNELPYAKDEIKKALLFAISVTEDSTMKEHLKLGYIELASWQDNVGESPQGIDLTNIDLSTDTQDLAKMVLQQSKDFEQWKDIVEQERKSLISDLKNFV